MTEGRLVVLQVLGGLNVGGAESRIMDITRNLSDARVSYDFLLHSKGNDVYEEEAKSLGCHIYRVPRFCFFNILSYRRAMKKFFASHPEIDIVQGHITSSASIYLPIAKKAGVKATIAHARSAGVDPGIKGKLTRLLRKNLYKKTDYMWTCSREAAESVFGKENAPNARFIPNAIDVDSFVLNDNLKLRRDEIVKKYELDGKFVVGHIGRFHYAKNHEFLIDIFAQILKLKENAVLLLVGDGEGRSMVEDKIRSYGLTGKVIFAGRQKDVAAYYHAFDVLVFPSRYEGLPGTIVESQASGIPAICSDSVTKDMAVTEYVRYLSLKESAEVWAKAAINMANEIAKEIIEPANKLKTAGFDIKSQCSNLETIYRELISKNDKG